tara:strand:+ start:28715 stop:29386 length:672 start_codon:yes stop_codon:yes gene_type:complete
MSDKLEIADSQVFTVYEWFQAAMKIAGRKTNFPRCSDPTKTYQFRWTKAFVTRCTNELEIDDKVMKALVYDMVAYAKREDLLNKGTQILSLSNIADICHHSIVNMMNDESSVIREIRSCHQFLLDQVGGKDISIHILKNPNELNGIPNVVYWYNLDYITEVYMALSAPCIKAINRIPPEFRSDLPTNFELLRICTHVLMDPDIAPVAKEIMGNNLRMLKTLRK